MKNGFNLKELQQQKKESAPWVAERECCICSKMLKGPYGRHMVDGKEVWTCSLDHERDYYVSTGRQPYTYQPSDH